MNIILKPYLKTQKDCDPVNICNKSLKDLIHYQNECARLNDGLNKNLKDLNYYRNELNKQRNQNEKDCDLEVNASCHFVTHNSEIMNDRVLPRMDDVDMCEAAKRDQGLIQSNSIMSSSISVTSDASSVFVINNSSASHTSTSWAVNSPAPPVDHYPRKYYTPFGDSSVGPFLDSFGSDLSVSGFGFINDNMVSNDTTIPSQPRCFNSNCFMRNSSSSNIDIDMGNMDQTVCQ